MLVIPYYRRFPVTVAENEHQIGVLQVKIHVLKKIKMT